MIDSRSHRNEALALIESPVLVSSTHQQSRFLMHKAANCE